MHTSNLRAVGGSVMVAIPKALLEALGLCPNHKVGLSVEAGRLVIDPAPPPSYTLAQLLGECEADAALSDEDAQWLAGDGQGREEI